MVKIRIKRPTVLKDFLFGCGIPADAVGIGKTIHPHPTLGESIGMAAEVAHGSCTDLQPKKPDDLLFMNAAEHFVKGKRQS